MEHVLAQEMPLMVELKMLYRDSELSIVVALVNHSYMEQRPRADWTRIARVLADNYNNSRIQLAEKMFCPEVKGKLTRKPLELGNICH